MRDALRFLWALVVIATLTILAAVLGGTVTACGTPSVFYGPPPLNDGGPPDGCMPNALYGPPPCTSNADCVTRMGAGWYCATADFGNDGCGGHSTWTVCQQGSVVDAGAPAKDASCEPMALYGPAPCSSNDDCTKWYGSGWYCDLGSSVNNGCSVTAWPMCKQGLVDAGLPVGDAACDPVALYGPPPCRSAADCDGGVCDQNHTFPDGCGGEYRFPICK
jgi:hypothetical protein